MDIAQQRFCCQLAVERGLIAQADLEACLAELDRRQPLPNPDSLAADLLKLGPPPTLDGLALLRVDEAGVRLLPAKAERPLGEKPVPSEKGFLDLLLHRVPQDWLLLRALAFPHQPSEAKSPQQPEGD